MLEELKDIPDALSNCFKQNKAVSLPLSVPYIGMGASYYVSLAPYYAGAKIEPQIASEYFNYFQNRQDKESVLISQSGKTSEVLWCLEKIDKVIVITNEPESVLAKSPKTKQVIDIKAGKEEYSSTKTYLNTLLVLYIGLGFDVRPALDLIDKKFSDFDKWGKQTAQKIYEVQPRKMSFYIIGSGPNIATAYESALIMSETQKFAVQGLPLAQYDHGPKETAKNSVVIAINTNGPTRKRTEDLIQKLEGVENCLVVELNEFGLDETISPLATVVPLYFLNNYLADFMGVDKGFLIGGKVTETGI